MTLKTALITLALSSSVSAFASNGPLKVAVVEGSTGSKAIIKGNYNTSIKRIAQRYKQEHSYDKNMNLCVAYLQAGEATKSESACTAAIKSAELVSSKNEQTLYLKSLSYNNRGISRYKNNDMQGALADLQTAVLIDSNDITLSNFNTIKQSLTAAIDDSNVNIAD